MVDFADIMATGRRSNSADAKDLAKIIRGNLAQLVPMSSLSLEEMARDHGDLLKDILKATSRPNSGLLKDALSKVFPSSPKEEVLACSSKLASTIQALFGKSRSMTTGDRLPMSVSNMCKFIRAEVASPKPSRASLAKWSPRKRERKVSPENSSQVVAVPAVDPVDHDMLPPDPASVAALYGLQTPKRKLGFEEDVVDLLSQDSEPIEAASSSKQVLKRPAIGTAKAKAATAVVYHLDYAARCLVKLSGNEKIRGEMAPGPDGFAVATFKDSTGMVLETKTTEMPNLMLEVVPGAKAVAKSKAKAKAKSKAKARAKAKAKSQAMAKAQAKGQAKPENSAGNAADAEAETQHGLRFQAERRSQNNSYGIRKVWRNDSGQECKRQVFQILCRSLSIEDGKKIANQAIAKLKAGEAEAATKTWATEQVEALIAG